jgi:hypothetical protein
MRMFHSTHVSSLIHTVVIFLLAWTVGGCKSDADRCLGVPLAKADPESCRKICEDKSHKHQFLACDRLGMLFEEGVVVGTDLAKAFEYYGKGCKGGNGRSCEKVVELSRKQATVEQPAKKRRRLHRDGGHDTMMPPPHMRQAIYDGRFSMNLPLRKPLEFSTSPGDESNRSDFVAQFTNYTIGMVIIESNFDDPMDDADAGLRGMVVNRQLKVIGGVEKERREIHLKGLGVDATVVMAEVASGNGTHVDRMAVFGADQHTLFLFFVDEKKANVIGGAAFEEMLHSLKAEKPVPVKPAKPVVKVSPEQLKAFEVASAGRAPASSEDLAACPKSIKPGEPSVANSCKLVIPECYETAFSSVDKGYYSNKQQCIGSFAEGPCPGEKRVGYCRLRNGRQLISMYATGNETLQESQKKQMRLCDSYSGEWLGLPAKRPWPKN